MRWLVVALALVACKKKSEQAAPPPTPAMPARTPEQPKPTPAPIPDAEVGPAYLSVQDAGVLTLTGPGWKVLAHPGDRWVTGTTIQLGVDGTLWAGDRSHVWKLDGGEFIEQPIKGSVEAFAGGGDGSLWFVSGGALHHLIAGKEAPIKLPTTDPPHALTGDLEGMWFSTLDRTYRGDGETWTAYDVPGVTGAQVDIISIQTRGRDAYLLTTENVLAFDGKRWMPVPGSRKKLGEYPSLVAGPAGRFAINTNDKLYAGDAVRGLREIGNRGEGVVADIDARGRIWLLGEGNVRVLDDNLKELKRWTAGDTPALGRRTVWLAIGEGGPAQLDQSELSAGTVTGKVEGSAADLAVRVCQQQTPEYNKEPCDGVAGTRTGKTAAGGTFSIANVAVGPQFFYVQRGGRWRATTPANPCCADLQPEGTFGVGTLTLQ